MISRICVHYRILTQKYIYMPMMHKSIKLLIKCLTTKRISKHLLSTYLYSHKQLAFHPVARCKQWGVVMNVKIRK